MNRVFALCDGANGAPLGDVAANTVSLAIVRDWPPMSHGELHMVDRAHDDLTRVAPEAATTLVALKLAGGGAQLISVGDSYAEIYRRPPWRGWRHVCSMPRDLDARGNPSQLLGAEVYQGAHSSAVQGRGDWCVFLMTDGAGDFLGPQDLLAVLDRIGRSAPTTDDLQYFCGMLAEDARLRGSEDDISVAAIWFRQ